MTSILVQFYHNFHDFCITYSSTDFTWIFHKFWEDFYVIFDVFLMTFLVIHPLGETLEIDDPYGTLACFSPSKIHDFSWFSRHVSLPFFISILDDILHRSWRHFGVLWASKTTFFRYRFSDDFLTCFLTLFGTLKCSIWDPFGTLKVIKKSSFS